METAARSHRRWSTYSLRVIFVSTALVAVLLAWVGANLEEQRREGAAVRALERFNCESRWGPSLLTRFTWLDDRLSRIGFLERIVALDLHAPTSGDSDFTDGDVPLLAPFKHLAIVSLNTPKLTSAGVRTICCDHPRLLMLSLYDCEINDALACCPLPELERLSICNNGFHDSDLAAFLGSPRLQEIYLSGGDIGDTVFDILGKFPRLKQVHLMFGDDTVEGRQEFERAHPYVRVFSNSDMTRETLEWLKAMETGRLHHKSIADQHFFEVVLVPSSDEAFVFHADLLA